MGKNLRPQQLHVVGFDDAPFERDHCADVLVVGAVYAGARLDGILSCKVRRDGADSQQHTRAASHRTPHRSWSDAGRKPRAGVNC